MEINLQTPFTDYIANFKKTLNQHGYYNSVLNNWDLISVKKSQTIILDFSCPLSKTFLQKHNENMFLNNILVAWIIFNSDIESIKNINIGVNSNFLIISSDNNNNNNNTDEYKIVSPYKTNTPSSEIFTNNVAVWNPEGFQYYNSYFDIRNRSNLLGTRMNFSFTLSNLNFTNHLTDYRETHLDTLNKYNYILVNILADAINVTRHFFIKKSLEYKTTNAAMMGDLQSGIAEIGVTPVFMSRDYLDLVDFVAPTTHVQAKFVFKSPPLSYMSNIFTLPFQSLVWYAGFVLMLVISIVLYVVASHECKIEDNGGDVDNMTTTHLQATIPDVLQIAIGAISQQGTELNPTSGSGRIAVFTTFVALLFLFTAYSANIVGLLQSTSDSIQTNADLLRSNIILAAEDIAYAKRLFSVEDEQTRAVIYKQITARGNFFDAETGMKRVRNEFFAFHVEFAHAYRIVSDTFRDDEKCGLAEVDYLIVQDPWLSIRKHSPFKEIFKITFLKMLESGIQKREFRKMFSLKSACSNKASIFTNVGLIDCYRVIVLFLSCVSLSIFLLGVEIVSYRKFGRICQCCYVKK